MNWERDTNWPQWERWLCTTPDGYKLDAEQRVAGAPDKLQVIGWRWYTVSADFDVMTRAGGEWCGTAPDLETAKARAMRAWLLASEMQALERMDR